MRERLGPLVVDEARARLQLHLSGGVRVRLPLCAAAYVWQRFARPARHGLLPAGARVIGVAGATLGGSGVTPTVQAIARRAAIAGARVCIVSHGYRGRDRQPRWVAPTDHASQVGDEALELSRALAPHGVRVVVGRPRSDALTLAATAADVVVVDGLLQATPEPLALSLLVVEGEEPWGSGACPPLGNLRAAPGALLEATDGVVWHEPAGLAARPGTAVGISTRPVYPTTSVLHIRDARGNPVPPEALRASKVGLIVGIARPERLITSLWRLGIRPTVVKSLADHACAGTFQAHEFRAPSVGVEAWLVTGKCVTKVGDHFARAPVLTVTREIRLPEALEHRLDGL